jgi:cellulose synthase operon protein C
MSSYAQVQLRPPQDWLAFERASVVLWGCILDDPHLTRFGRQGQIQHGLDLTGYREGDPHKLVGVQCKSIGQPGALKEGVVREDLAKAAGYDPPLTEYIVTTTAENNAKLDQLAHRLTAEYASREWN